MKNLSWYMPPLRRGPVAKWRQLAAIYRDKIRSGELQAEDGLPGKPWMEQEYGISQKTVERAMKELRAEGLIQTVEGLGQFVLPADRWVQPPPVTPSGS